MKGNSHLDLTSLIKRMLMQRYKIQILINRLKKVSVFFFSLSYVCCFFITRSIPFWMFLESEMLQRAENPADVTSA